MRSFVILLVLVSVYCDGKIEKELIKGRRILKGNHIEQIPGTLIKSPHKAILRAEPMEKTKFRKIPENFNKTDGNDVDAVTKNFINGENVDVFKIIISGFIKRGNDRKK